jgi:hypothetical protein
MRNMMLLLLVGSGWMRRIPTAAGGKQFESYPCRRDGQAQQYHYIASNTPKNHSKPFKTIHKWRYSPENDGLDCAREWS